MSIFPKDSDFQIDPYCLDEEWVKQPDTFRKYSEALAEAKRDFEEAKNRLAVVRAETDLTVRKKPSKYGLDKLTEGVIKAAVEIDEGVVKAEADVVEARYEVNLLEAAVGSLDHRKRALSDLVSLHLADYYSKPVARFEDREAAEDMGKQQARKSQRKRKSNDS